MAKLTLRTNFLDGQILYGNDLNSTNAQVMAAVNDHHDSIEEIIAELNTLPNEMKEYVDVQIGLAAEDFALTDAYKSDIADLEGEISSVSEVATQNHDDLILFTDETYVNDKSAIQSQIDGKIESYFQETDPNDWLEADRIKHDGDMWYCTDTDILKLYRYNSTSDTWEEITDKAALDAYELASNAASTADGKCATFMTTPIPPYNVGDLWVGGGNSDLKRCIVARATGDYDADDWELATKYTDDSGLDTFVNGSYADLVNAVDGIVSSYFSYDDPSILWDNDTKKNLHVGDLWRDRNTNISYRYDKSTDEIPVYSWQEDDIPSSMFDLIDGKKSVHTLKPTEYSANDMFIVPPGLEDLPDNIKVGDILVSSQANLTFDWADWNKLVGYVQQDVIDAALAPIQQNLTDVINDLDLNNSSSKLSQIIQSINAVTTNFQIKGGANLIVNSLQLFSQLNSDTFEKDGTWEIRQNQDISNNTVSNFMNYSTESGYLKWTIRVNPNTAYTLSMIYNNPIGVVSKLKLTNGTLTELIDTDDEKLNENFEYGFVTNSNVIIIEINTNGAEFGYSDLMLNYGALIENDVISANALKWQPAPGENFGTTIKMSYEGIEVRMKSGLFKHIMDNTGDRIVLLDENGAELSTVTEFDEME